MFPPNHSSAIEDLRHQYARVKQLEALNAELLGALEAINRRAAHHPDDDDNDRKRMLRHIESISSTAIKKARNQ